jgi:uncharacterized protein YkwD
MKTKLFLIFFVISVFISCEKEEATIPSTQEKEKTAGQSDFENEILNLVNSHRSSIGKDPLVVNQYIQEKALEHTNYMISINDLNHDNFSERANSIWENVGSGAIAENVAYGYSSASAVVEGWLNSAGHKKNIEGNYNLTGISAQKDDNGRYYYTQIFLHYNP